MCRIAADYTCWVRIRIECDAYTCCLVRSSRLSCDVIIRYNKRSFVSHDYESRSKKCELSLPFSSNPNDAPFLDLHSLRKCTLFHVLASDARQHKYSNSDDRQSFFQRIVRTCALRQFGLTMSNTSRLQT